MKYLIFFLFAGCASFENTLPTFSSLDFEWPVKKSRLSQTFSPPENPKHEGIDLASLRGTPIYATETGTVIFSGVKYSGYGKMIIIKHRKGWASLYAHLDKIHVKKGQRVNQGQWIGNMGNTGKSKGVHLHFELIKDKIPVNPLKYLPRKLR